MKAVLLYHITLLLASTGSPKSFSVLEACGLRPALLTGDAGFLFQGGEAGCAVLWTGFWRLMCVLRRNPHVECSPFCPLPYQMSSDCPMAFHCLQVLWPRPQDDPPRVKLRSVQRGAAAQRRKQSSAHLPLPSHLLDGVLREY